MNLSQILKSIDDPFIDPVDPELLRKAEERAKAIRDSERDPAADPPSSDIEQGPDRSEADGGDIDPVQVTGSPEDMHAELSASVAGKGLATARIISEPPQMRGFRDAMRAATGVEGVITRGDTPIQALAPAPLSSEEVLRALGFPERPQTWPAIMAWPPQMVLDRYVAPGVTTEQKAEMINGLLALDARMLRRSRQIRDWMEKHNPIEGQDSASRKQVGSSVADPHYGIRWATLINPGMQDQSLMASVLSWGYGRAITADGGSVLAHEDSISFSDRSHGPACVTPQSVALGIREARNRGWSKINMQGSYEFGMLALKAAKELGVEATITYSGRGLLSWKTYTVKVMPNAPLPELPEPEGQAPGVAGRADGLMPARRGRVVEIPDTSSPSPTG